MRNLLNFIIRYSTWFVFTFYVLLSCILLFSTPGYRQSVYLTSANKVSSTLYSGVAGVTGYFGLKAINDDLQASNAQLENEVLNLRSQISELKTMVSDSVLGKVKGDHDRFNYVLASVINNSTRHPRNFFTINKGEADGVGAGMGVVDHNGVVGIVNVTGKNTSRVISLLNETQHFSVRLKDTPYVGSLSWKGGDPTIAYVEEIPRHVKFRTGDSIVTSGFSTTFPEGIFVGKVMNRVKGGDDNFYILKIRLSSDFKTLGQVRVIKDHLKPELDSLANYDVIPKK